MKKTNRFREKLKRMEDKLNKESNDIELNKKLNNELIKVIKDLDEKIFIVTKLEAEFTKKIEILQN